jgi:hypothetical protein
MCAFILFMLSCVQVTALRRADHPSKESNRLCKKDQETEKAAKVRQMAVEPHICDRFIIPSNDK